jgi:glycerol kinase
MTSHLLAIDQGTTSSGATVFRADYTVAAIAQQEIPRSRSPAGLNTIRRICDARWWRPAARQSPWPGLPARDFAAIGITNQRETTLVWDRTAASRSTTMHRLADILGASVDRPTIMETTVLGAAYLAGLPSSLCPDPPEFAGRWALDRCFTAAMDETNDGDGPTNEPARRERQPRGCSCGITASAGRPQVSPPPSAASHAHCCLPL